MGPDEVLLVFILNINYYSFLKNMAEDNVRMRQREEVRTQTHTAPANATATSSAMQTREADGVCPKCGAAISADMELCPVCGWKVVDYCTFCGAPMTPDDMDCPECGMPADGVLCPDCGVRNFRPFCRQCGKPLSRAARMAVEKAKADPKVQETARLMRRMAELQAELEALEREEAIEAEAAKPRELSDVEKRYRELMAKVGFTPAEVPKVSKVTKSTRSREAILTEFKKTVDDTDRVLEEMLPPAGTTPQEQRNYFTARKQAVIEIATEVFYGINPQETMVWQCNHCHVTHSSPEACSFREFGGQWISDPDWKRWTLVDV